MGEVENVSSDFKDLVVVGSSAGGVEALSVLVSTLPANFPAPLVLAQHLDASRPSSLDSILQRRTVLPVHVVTSRTAIEAGKIYVVPSNHHVSINDHYIEVREDKQNKRPRPSVDGLFSSAAEAYGERLIAVILTGSGSDGAAGAVDVKNAGGTVIVQDPQTARYPSMPLALPPTVIDFEASVERIGPLLYDLLTGVSLPQPEERTEDVLHSILEQVTRQASMDFRSYKTSTILRRIGRRMTLTHSATMREYLEYLKIYPEEVGELVKALPAPNRASLSDGQVQRSTRRGDQRPSRMMGKQLSEQESLTPSHDLGQLQRLNELLLRYLPVGVLVIDRSYHVLTANGTARRLLGLRDIINEQDFLHAVRGIPYTEVRSAIDAVFRERSIITLPEVELATSTGGNGRFICISIALMQIEAGSLDLAAISVTDVTEQVQVRRQLETVRAEQAQLMNELSSSNKRLNDMNKELMDSKHDADGKVSGVIIYAVDETTERAREVVAERERLRLIFDNANVTALALYDAQTAELIIGSSRYLDLVARAHGIERSELIGRKWQELTFVTPPEQAATIWDTVVGSHVPVRLPEVYYKFAEDGQERVWDWSLTPVMGMEEPDTVRFALVSMIEITEQALARREMERLNRIKDEFLSLASHELRTPLSAIKGNAELLQRGLKQQLKARGRSSSDKATRPLDSEQEIHMLERVISQADHMNKLIGEMLDMTRIRADVLELRKKENVNIVELARRTVEQYASITNHPFTLHSSQEAILGNWDEIRLEQVLDNLISNAVKYSPPGKPVTVSIERRSEPTPEVIVWVRDEGRGISEEEQAHIFDRFYRGRNDEQFRIEGLGLGLYISNEIITRQGGRIWLESKPGEGSTFYVSLPL